MKEETGIEGGEDISSGHLYLWMASLLMATVTTSINKSHVIAAQKCCNNRMLYIFKSAPRKNPNHLHPNGLLLTLT